MNHRTYMRAKADTRIRAKRDVMCLFKVGESFELYYADAEDAAKAAGLTVTKRENDADQELVPTAGFPVEQFDKIVAKLGEAGYQTEVVEDAKVVK